MIDARAVIDPEARIEEGVHIGAFTVIGPGVSIGKGTWIGSHVVITGTTHIGQDCKIYQFASLGEAPQDLGYRDEETALEIGDRTVIREYVTISRGTPKGGAVTRVGTDNLIMAYVHIAHDCLVGNHVVFSNAASLAGHCQVGDRAVLGGFTLVHQFCRVGSHAFTSMGSALNRDLPPYCMASGNYARAIGINKIGLRRRGYSGETIRALQRTFRHLVDGRNREQGLAAVAPLVQAYPEVADFVAFVRESPRGILRTDRRRSTD
ncbi:acyl-ACP--UDP-N-acetylglucosamine O-acyltransferase [Ectothiorhodospira lacustris]|uniref:acyl-ACP--UDP-N-acetylglucosamine O-acyltransferase n=1 Tax=Ectothiorhodospira lacustris TaxID=2899127 RepID=UPI001EE80C0E|nr:acyl-ACP--UDP-N-acetylglucosamine O-acyltransferase [Ectothiorhodospira lacustris]MCG5500072.1 acyl-ACP--UDP-N-acetylglucosamine O-acyltransferase [Ectothiorhodospira lacustris]MCG5509426.1 acyl-ACP--UDP-N-acetylglucosamine O-acyltransferase [Ectothiorhodospira lacustris]MCG5521480.1 acyl-ACP--UDP-N-acetylglucosamine O-acyltransferase [Ectothiorhodospira lacustris]